MSYRDQFTRGGAARQYDETEYAPDSYAHIIWSIERGLIDRVLTEQAPNHFSYLDFACGTGRVLGYVAQRSHSARGIEISQAMADRARKQLPDVQVDVKDITAPDSPIEDTYDVITAFRFLLNAEPELRLAALRALRARFASHESLLILNNHGNLLSHKAVMAIPHYVRRGGRRLPEGNLMTHRSVVRLAADAGLSLQRVGGAGALGGRLAAKLPYRFVIAMERGFARTPLSRFGSNQVYVARVRSNSSLRSEEL